MRKVIKTCSFRIIQGEHYFCVIGNKLSIYRISDMERVCTFSDMKYYSCGNFVDDTTFVARNTIGIYKVYDIEKVICIKTIQFDEIDQSGQDSEFILSPKKDYLFDILDCRERSDMRFYKIEIATGEASFLTIHNLMRVSKFLTYDEQNNSVRFVNSLFNVLEVNLDSMTIKTAYYDSLQLILEAHLFFDNRYVLNKKMEIIDIETKTLIRKIDYRFVTNQHSYLVSTSLHNNNQHLAIVYSDKIVILDFISGKVLFEYTDKYCSCVCFVGDYLLLGTWTKVVIIDNPLLKPASV